MRNRFIASLALACLVAITFAAGATAEVVNRSSAPPRMPTKGGLKRFMGPPIKIEGCEQDPFNVGAAGPPPDLPHCRFAGLLLLYWYSTLSWA